MALGSVGWAAVSTRSLLLDGLALRIGELEAVRAHQSGDLYSPTGLGGGSCARSILGGFLETETLPPSRGVNGRERRAMEPPPQPRRKETTVNKRNGDAGADQLTHKQGEAVERAALAAKLRHDATARGDRSQGRSSEPERAAALTGDVLEQLQLDVLRTGTDPDAEAALNRAEAEGLALAERSALRTPAAKPGAKPPRRRGRGSPREPVEALPAAEPEGLAGARLELADPEDVDAILDALARDLWDGEGEPPIPTADAIAVDRAEQFADGTAPWSVLFSLGHHVTDLGPLLHAQWLEAPLPRRVHPLAAVVREWWKVRVPGVRAETRTDPILPVVRVIESPETLAGQLAFGGLTRDDLPPAQLPMFPRVEGPRVPLLELADIRGGPIMAKGRGAPLDLRLFIAACLLTPRDARASRRRLAVTVRDLRRFLFPHGWERRRDWPRVRAALWKARDYTIPDGTGLWLPFALRRDPGADAALDDLVLIDVELPPGAATGPPIDRRALALLGVESAPRFRALIAGRSVVWVPGTTRRPVPGSLLWGWSRDASDYPILTAEDRRRLAFGEDDKGHRTRAQQDAAWEDLPGVVIAERAAVLPDGRIGWRIVPAESVKDPSGEDDPEE